MKTSLFLACAVGFGSLVTRASAVDFEKEILPIIKGKCYKCHQSEHTDETGKVKKPKGGLVLDNPESFKKGGKEDKDKVLQAGKGADSTIYTSTTLPESDDKAMPPEGKGDRVTKAEQELLKKWIDEGANFGAWKGTAK